MQITRSFLVLCAGMGLMLASPALAEEEAAEPKGPEATLQQRDSDAKRHITCQVECEKDGEDPYQCEEFCVQMADLKCTPTATVAKH